MLIIPFFLAVLIALLKSFNSFASLLPTEPELSPFLIPIPTPLPKAPPEKVGPTKTTGLPDLAA